MKKAIIIGASSGIGYDLAKVLAKEGYELGLIARRYELLTSLQNELQTNVYLRKLDITHLSEAISTIDSLIQEMNGVDLFIINAGIRWHNPKLDWPKEKETIEVNVMAFAAMADLAMKYFLGKGKGHLVGISSIASIRGNSDAPAYNASKAFASSYLEGLRILAFRSKKQIVVTTIEPGYVDTQMTRGRGFFWVESSKKAAEQIYGTIERKKEHAYITHRWRLIAWLIKIAPKFLYDRFV